MSKQKAEALVVTSSEGLTGYLTYISRCGMSPAYSEYMLYGPIVRVAADKQWNVFSEESAQIKSGRGDNLKVDFYLEAKEKKYSNLSVALEVKWIPYSRGTFSIEHDVKKLRLIDNRYKDRQVYKYVMLVGDHKLSRYKKSEDNENVLSKLPKIKGIDDRIKVLFQTIYSTRHSSYGSTILEVL